MKFTLESAEESDEFSVIQIVHYDGQANSAVLARIAARLDLVEGQLVVEVQAKNTTIKPDVVFKGVSET
ncbi:MAG TPA: hypothetical protein VLA89_16570 [Gemmatimonadales bacterium]|nr:hypothetical protein [Gemmatimonadales bacterium]